MMAQAQMSTHETERSRRQLQELAWRKIRIDKTFSSPWNMEVALLYRLGFREKPQKTHFECCRGSNKKEKHPPRPKKKKKERKKERKKETPPSKLSISTAMSRNSQLRCSIYRFLSSSNTSSFRCHSTKSLLQPFRSTHQPLSPSDVKSVQYGRRMLNRLMCTSASGGSQKIAEQGKPVRGSPVSWMSFVLLVGTGAGLVSYYDREKKRHIEEINSASNAVKQGPSVGKAAIGGPFNLVDHNGKSVTEKDFLGKWSLIYFGFTHCPDICPDELQKLAAAIDKIKEISGIQVVPVFISVDPERDTVEQVREYVKEFHPDLIGLTGSQDEVKKAARAYRVYYMKTEDEGSDYLVDHSIVMYLMDPRMEFVKFFGKNNDVDTLADGVIKEIKQYKKVKA